MSEPDLTQIIDTIGFGVIVIDANCRVVHWNPWLEHASGLRRQEVLERNLVELFPELGKPAFQRNLRSVFSFGNFAYFSQRVHGHLIRLPMVGADPVFDALMEQQCTMGPIKAAGKVVYAYILIQDVTEAVQRERLLAELAMKDVLTAAYNRRYFNRRLDEELDRCRRYKRCLGLVMLDLDHFKDVNDNFGHQFGDEALKHAALAWIGAVRASDVVTRYGGEEFCVLLPETGLEEASHLADRIRRACSATEVSNGTQRLRISASAGVTVSQSGDGPDDILRRADEALYRAKANGRDRIEIST
ncbi:MAG: hypothetical protein A2087_06785 [Spirochaetes bacterium GWD1_61_31]|nr:MAG: hypothetical protein A2Y37_08685 [Spirochaetes bacterium GWB1_60_80]OHD40054.1 MAG: hypothetical protein A2087_06785 [Spirochaetes bacterium GWD1_61_31]OHD45897.1 MAG: hypothetical protein A2Y35_04320 [Spirochaetes bacterium GWE1_60_18]OHD58441.1 MAG: hypothetical protein A2Y32_06710 [Spirochaetes bacterium GWF1_60_12]HAP44011.1 sensor domain-containing diguanylate cyclase [Spirochaetaceae bacterium]